MQSNTVAVENQTINFVRISVENRKSDPFSLVDGHYVDVAIQELVEHLHDTPTERQLLGHMLDITCDTTVDGDPRCENVYEAFDGSGFSIRCPNEARIRTFIEGDGCWLARTRCFSCSLSADRVRELLTS